MARKDYNKKEKSEATDKAMENKERNKKGGKKNRNDKGSGAKNSNTVPVSTALLDAAASLSFPTTAGYPVDLTRGKSESGFTLDQISADSMRVRIPGVMRLGYIPAMGKMQSWSDAFNVWIRRLYTFIRHANSGSANYAAADIGKYMLLWRSCRDYLLWMERVLGVAVGTYIPANAYTPKAIVEMMGVDYDAIILELAQLRFYITSFGARLFQMKVPNLNYFTTGSALISNVYADCENNKASFYLFDPDGFWRYHIGDTAEDTYLYIDQIPNWGSISLEDIKSFGEQILNDLLNSEDFNIMSGDILKAYTEFATVPMIDENYSVTPIYDAGLLWAIHNSNTLHGSRTNALSDFVNWKIMENTSTDLGVSGSMKSTFYVNYASASTSRDAGLVAVTGANHLIDLPMDSPDAATVGFVTRFINHVNFREAGYGTYEVVTCQSEIITSRMVLDDPFKMNQRPATFDNVGAINAFDMHPYIYDSVSVNGAVGLLDVSVNGAPVGEMTNITSMTPTVKENIDMAVMLGVFSMT